MLQDRSLTVSSFQTGSPAQMNLSHRPIRFGENNETKETAPALPLPVDIQPLEKNLKSRTDLQKNVKQKNLFGGEGFFRFLGNAALIGAAFMGFSTIQKGNGELKQYYDSVPTGEKAKLEHRMKDRDKYVVEPLYALSKSSGQFESMLYSAGAYSHKVDYIHQYMNHQEQLRSVVRGFIADLNAEKNPADKTLIEKLVEINRFDLSDNWEARERMLNSDLVKFYGRLAQTVQTNEEAGMIEPIRTLVQEAPEFSHLSAAEKENLAGGILSIVYQGDKLSSVNRSYGRNDFLQQMGREGTAERKLYHLLKFYQGDLIHLPHAFGTKDFKDDLNNLQSYQYYLRDQDKPLQFITNLVNHPENFKTLTPEEKARFLAQGKETLSVLSHRFHQSPGDEFFDDNHFLIMMGVLGLLASTGALTLWNGYRFLQWREKTYGKDRTLHVTADEMDKEKVANLEKQIRTLCEEVAKPRLSAFNRGTSEITAYFERLYGPEQLEIFKKNPAKLTDLLASQYMFQTYETLLPDQKNNKITSLALYQKVLARVQQAVREKDYLPEGFLTDPWVRDDVPKASDSFSDAFTEEKLKAGIIEVERLRTHTYTVLVNQLLAEIPFQEAVEAHQQKLAALEAKANTDGHDTLLPQQVVLERRAHQTEETLYQNARQRTTEIRETLKKLDDQKMALNLLLLELQEKARLKVADEDGGRIEGLKLATSEAPLLAEIKLRLEANTLLKTLSGQTEESSHGKTPPDPL